MFNHVRTLLANLSHAANSDAIGEEFISSAFRPLVLTGRLLQFHQALYGATPDRDYANYRTFEFLQLLHAPQIEAMTLQYDSRITYTPWRKDIFAPSTFEPSIETTATSDSLQIIKPYATANNNRLKRYWKIDSNGSEVTVDTTTTTSLVSPEFSGGRSAIIETVDQELQFTITDEVAIWHVHQVLRPTVTILNVWQNVKNILQPALLRELFPDNAEPVASYNNMFKATAWPVSFAGLLLAFVERLTVGLANNEFELTNE